MIALICIAAIILIIWLNILEHSKHCPNCGSELIDKVSNGYHCRYCGKLSHMNIFGKLKKRK